MVIALPVWMGRVSPVLDTAERLCVVRSGPDGSERLEVVLGDRLLALRAAQLSSLGVDVLICGALSRPLLIMLEGAGIRVIPWVTGCVDEVVAAFCSGRLEDARFSLPGHDRAGPGHRRRYRGGRDAMPQSKADGFAPCRSARFPP
jgi:predicted Fe-Mo cluster-binding NifX family protein